MVSQTSRALSVSVCLFVRAPYLSEELLFKVKKRIKWSEKKKAFSCGKGENGNKIFETDDKTVDLFRYPENTETESWGKDNNETNQRLAISTVRNRVINNQT